ncbi:polysaccharide biosynthesis protein [Bordetella avium]|uniref:polysaccharide biosynthesis protein n=1 Tax=Bordetella avium TaxID=521 RepID=UPI000E0BF558|nr:nucleoside-diphosphate sugar epimerase/dehydratase [Bordetella avium]AZY47769.1 polysaccharide biosynthesis protein [Bordetella avium]AZY51138.1 polysaccharide biosynthesis protein [Bordetella avium]RIQ15005.1 NAD-dependent epimerase/dehydratase family protein [Bordetella avium]RIQ18504.1 NAD-dependent epimerase/dehydratase family protein [Bordetella avium]RIQ35460.1 NAD-dependent epimerase/dehydratase family protein [Bordetella avium]
MIKHLLLKSSLLNLPRSAKQALNMVLDALVLLLAFQLALWFRFELFYLTSPYLILSVLACAGGLFTLALLGTYKYVLRYMDEHVVLRILIGVAGSVMLVTAINTFMQLVGLSRAVLAIYALLALSGLLGLRWLGRRLLFSFDPKSETTGIPVIIYGGGGAGSQLAAALRAGPYYRPVAMIDDDQRKQGLRVAGLRIYPVSALDHLIKQYDVRQLLIAMPNIPRSRLREIVETVEHYRLRIRLVPSLRELVDQNGPRLRDIRVEDLLGRDAVAPIPSLLGRCVTGRNVMVSGAGGSIGSELCRQILAQKPRSLVLLEISEPALYAIERELSALGRQQGIHIAGVLGSVRDAELCTAQMRKHHIHTVYHAAAYKHVPIVEENITEGLRTNTFGTRTFAQCAIDSDVSDFVLISTDKAVRPTNVMGASKRMAELVLQAYAKTQTGTRFSMVRFGNVLGSSGSVVPLFHAQIMAGGPITLTHEKITRYFMTIPEAAQLVLQAGSMGESGAVFVLDMGEPVHIRDLALRMIRLYGLTLRSAEQPDGDIEIKITGLRPGEKLYEELLIAGNTVTTEHPRIMQAHEIDLPPAVLNARLETLASMLNVAEHRDILQHIKQIVPEYQPYDAAPDQGSDITLSGDRKTNPVA